MGIAKTIFISVFVLGLAVSLFVYYFIYLKQEKAMFFPEKLPSDYQFNFAQDFQEIFVETKDGNKLNGLLFKSKESKGLIFYLHGNGGSLRSWGEISPYYIELGFDLFILDYRGYGKSEGQISSESQFYSDVQTAFDEISKPYKEKAIIILGYSIGTGPAAWLASQNSADLLILQAPYYSIKDLKNQWYPIIPDFFIKYKFETFHHLAKVKAPVVIIHGERDEIISYQSSVKLQQHFKKGDSLFPLKNQMHNGMSFNPEYREILSSLLTNEPR